MTLTRVLRMQRSRAKQQSKRLQLVQNKCSKDYTGFCFDVPTFDFSDVEMDKVLDIQPDSIDGATGVEQKPMQLEITQSKSKSIMEAVFKNDLASLTALVKMERTKAQGSATKTCKLQNHLNLAIQQAVTSRSVKMVAALLDCGAEVQSSQSSPALTICAINLDCEELVDLFLKRGLSFQMKGKANGSTVLDSVARIGNVNILEKLLGLEEVRAQVNSVSRLNQTTPLLVAALYSRTRCAQLLIEAGADVHQKDYKGRTALHFAGINGSNALVHILMSHGASAEVLDEESKTPWFYSLLYNHKDTMDLLESNRPVVTSVIHRGKNYLHLAAECGNVCAVNILLARGCDPGAQDDQGMTPLMYAVSSGFVLSIIVNRLLETSVCKQTINVLNCRGESALSILMMNGVFCVMHQQVASALVSSGADVNLGGQSGPTPLMSAIHDEQRLRFMLENGADINTVTSDNRSCLSYALSSGQRTTTLRLLVSYNIDMRLASLADKTTGTTPFIQALESGDIETVNILEQSGTHLNGVFQWSTSDNGQRAQHRNREIREYITKLKNAGRIGEPLSLWHGCRLAILAALGRTESCHMQNKLSQLGLPPVLASVASVVYAENN